MGCSRVLYKLFCTSILLFTLILLGPSRLPDTVEFTKFDIPSVKNLGKGLTENDLLNNAERLFEDNIKGPEGFAVVNGELYTTLHGGFVAKVTDDEIIPVVKFGKPCIGWWEESKCGRPLGIKALGNDQLIVADAYFGIYKYNINTKKIVNLVKKGTVIDGKPAKIFNSVEVTKDGSIYWTHSSSDFELEDGVYAFLADGSGRLMKYDPVTQKNEVLLKDLFFPNGLALSPDEDSLLIAETGKSRVLKYHLKGPKTHTVEVFLDGMPGVPDNLRANGDKEYFVPLVVTRDENNPLFFQLLSTVPVARKFLVRSLSLIELFFEEVDRIYPNYYTKRAIHFIGHLGVADVLFNKKTTVLVVDLNGNVIRSYQGFDGTVSSVSDVIPHNGYLYLGSPTNNYLARVKLSKLGIKSVVKPSAPPASAPPPPPPANPPRPSAPPASAPPPPPPANSPRPSSTTTKSPPTTTKPSSRPTEQTPPTPQPRTTTVKPSQPHSKVPNQKK